MCVVVARPSSPVRQSIRTAHSAVSSHCVPLKKADREASKPRIRELEARIPELEAAIKLRQEQKEEQKDEED